MGSGTLFNGDSIKLLKEKMKFKGGTQLLNVSGVPTDTATDGSYAFSDNGKDYKRAGGVWVETNQFTDAEKLIVSKAFIDGGNSPAGAMYLGTSNTQTLTIMWNDTIRMGFNTAGTTMFSTMDMGGSILKGVPTPTADDHAVRKDYVDPLYQINKDRGEPAGFIRDNQATMGIIELCPHFVDSSDYVLHRVYQDGSFATSVVGHPYYDVALTGRTTFYDNTELLASRKLCLSPVSGTDMEVYIDSVKHTFTASQSVVFPDQSGLQFVYFNASGILSTDDVVNKDFLKKLPIVSLVYGNATTQELVTFADERHGIVWDGDNHVYEHFTGGARYAGGMDIAGLADGLNTHGLVSEGFMYDEDLFQTLPDQATMPFWYIDGTTWRIIQDGNTLGLIDGLDTYVSYNENIAPDPINDPPEYALTEMTGVLKCTIMFLLATNDKVTPYVKIVGQNQYDSPNEARDAIGTELSSLVTEGLPTPEFVFVAGYIIRRDGDLEALDDGSTHVDLRTIKVNAQGAGATAIVDHRKVTNRDAVDQHPASSITFDPTIEGIIDPTIVEAQSAIDAVSKLAGAGDTSTYKVLDADNEKASSWTVVGDTVFGEETVNNLKGAVSYKYTQVGTSAVGDKATSPVIDVPKQSLDGSMHSLKIRYTLSGGALDEDFGMVIRGAALDVISTTLMKNGTTRVTKSFNVKANAEIYAQVYVNSVTSGATLVFDSVEFADTFGEYGSIVVSETSRIYGATGRGTTDTRIVAMADNATNDDNDLYKITTTVANGTILEFKAPCEADVSVDGSFSASNTFGLSVNSTELTTSISVLTDKSEILALTLAGASTSASCSAKRNFVNGDKVRIHTGTSGILTSDISFHFSVTATAQSQTTQFVDEYEQASKKGKAIYNLTSNYSTSSASYVLPALTLTSSTLSGVLEQNTANSPSLTIPNAKAGTYKVAVASKIGSGGGASSSFLEIFDGVTSHSPQSLYASTVGSFVFDVELASDGDLNLDLRLKTDGIVYIESIVPLELSVSYEPPVEEASATRLLNVPMLIHSEEEFYTGEKWIDDRKIYGRSFGYAQSIAANTFTVLDTIDTGYEVVGINGVVRGSVTNKYYNINATADVGTANYCGYEISTGELEFKNGLATDRQIVELRYVKP